MGGGSAKYRVRTCILWAILLKGRRGGAEGCQFDLDAQLVYKAWKTSQE